MKKLLLLLIIPFLSFGQSWEQTFGGTGYDTGMSVQQTSDGGYIVTGVIDNGEGDGNGDIYLVKTTDSGEEQWAQMIGYGGYVSESWNGFIEEWYDFSDYGLSVQQTPDGGYIICGQEWGIGSTESTRVIKTFQNGVEQWSQLFDNHPRLWLNSIKQTVDGGYILSGQECNNFNVDSSPPSNYCNACLFKISESGAEEWVVEFNILYNQGGHFVEQTSDEGYITSGYTEGKGGQIQYLFLLKTNGSGEEQWVQIFGGGTDGFIELSGPESGIGSEVHQTSDGGYIITGTITGDDGSWDLYLIKTNGMGVEEWSQTFGGAGDDTAQSVQQTSDGGYIVTGSKENEDGDWDLYLIKTNGMGVEEWSQTFGGAGDDIGMSVQQTSDGGYIVTGGKENENEDGDWDLYLIKTNEFGNITSTNIIETPTINKTLITTVDILGRETTNKGFQLHIYDDGSVEKKYLIK